MNIPIAGQDVADLLSKIKGGRLLDILTIDAQADLCDWIDNQDLLEGAPFLVKVATAIDGVELYCKCSIDMSGDEPKIESTVIPGMRIPANMNSLPSFAVERSDIEEQTNGKD